MTEYKSETYEIKIAKNSQPFPRMQIMSSHDANEYARQFYFEDLEVFESFFLIILNRQNQTTGYAKISQGGTNATVIDVKLIANYAINALAESVILVHNHPSGNKKPSTADIQVTNKVTNALKLFDIKVLDHIILTTQSYTSMADEGLLEN